jgi:hypothetical protein
VRYCPIFPAVETTMMALYDFVPALIIRFKIFFYDRVVEATFKNYIANGFAYATSVALRGTII